MAQKSLDLIEAMRVITEKAQPITGRGNRIQAVHRWSDPLDGAIRNAAGLPPAQGST
jgi:hypothetical protein